MSLVARRLDTVEEYYFSKKLKEVRTLVSNGAAVINLGIGSPDLPPHPSVLTALENSLSEPQAHKYQSYQGLPELRHAISSFYEKNYNVLINAENEILPLMGSKEGIMHISMAYLNEGDAVLIPNPGYPTYSSVTKLVGATPIFYDLTAENHWQPQISAGTIGSFKSENHVDQLPTHAYRYTWLRTAFNGFNSIRKKTQYSACQ